MTNYKKDTKNNDNYLDNQMPVPIPWQEPVVLSGAYVPNPKLAKELMRRATEGLEKVLAEKNKSD